MPPTAKAVAEKTVEKQNNEAEKEEEDDELWGDLMMICLDAAFTPFAKRDSGAVFCKHLLCFGSRKSSCWRELSFHGAGAVLVC